MTKKIVLIILMLLLSAGSVYAQDITITLDGSKVSFNQDTGMPYIDASGRVMTPLRAVLEQAGAHVSYDSGARGATITTVDKEIYVPIDQWIIVVNGKNKVNDAPATLRNGRIYLPIRIVMESLGYSVGWNTPERTVTIKKVPVIINPVAPVTTPTPVVTTPTITTTTTTVELKVNTVGNTNVNLYNGGLIAREKNYLYFVNFNDSERLWRVNVINGKANVISTRKVRSINVVNDWVYYRQENISGIWEVWKAKGDASVVTDVINDNVGFLRVEGDSMYFYKTATKELLKRDIDKSYNTTVENVDLAKLSMEDGQLIYTERTTNANGTTVDGDLLSKNMNNGIKSTLLTEKTGEDDSLAFSTGGKLVYRRANDALSLWVMDLSTGKRTKLNDQRSYVASADSQYVYTMYPQYNAGLYKISMDGMTQVKMNVSWSPFFYYDTFLTASGDYIYYADKLSGENYQWVRVKKDNSDVKRITEPADFME